MPASSWRHLLFRIDPWLFRATGGRYPWILGSAATAPLVSMGARSGLRREHPECEFGDERYVATEVTDPDEYTRLFGLAEHVWSGYGDYRAKTAAVGRRIPGFRLTPR